MNVVDQAVPSQVVPSGPPPPDQYPVGTIATLRMRGHTRTHGEEYWAPAVILAQHEPNGEIEVLIWDSTAGTHYNPAYQIRDLEARMNERGEREMYVSRENIGDVLFNPQEFSRMLVQMDNLEAGFDLLSRRIAELEKQITAKPVQAPVHPPVQNPTDKK